VEKSIKKELFLISAIQTCKVEKKLIVKENFLRNLKVSASISSQIERGRNVKFHYYDRPFFSLHRKWLFSRSLLRHHYIENGFLIDHYYDITTSQVPF
jgi:hypothetical protein